MRGAGVGGPLLPQTPHAARPGVWPSPAMTLAVVARIHWQALRLFFKKVRFFGKPTPPTQYITRNRE